MTEEESPWYKKGLHFKCTECGKCCTGSPGYVWLTEEEIEAIASYLHLSAQNFKKKYVRRSHNRYSLIEKRTQQYDCIFLKDKQCQIYPVRPSQCQTFPWWQDNLKSEQSWQLAAQECEGIQDDAPIVPYDEIIKQLKRR